MKPTLVILAAGMGSRFGGMKQTEPIGPNGEFIIDYSIHDAVKAGFEKVVFIIRREFEDKFRSTVGCRAEKVIKVDYAFQELRDLPPEFMPSPEGRIKPWGTGHAVYCARNVVHEPFAVINSDDYYGRQAFEIVQGFLADEANRDMCMAGYYIENTLTENGFVSRGQCETDKDGFLVKIDERLKVGRKDGKIVFSENGEDIEIPERTIASMNFFGFPMGAMDWFEEGVRDVLLDCRDFMTAEIYLPVLVTGFIMKGKAKAKVLATDEKWYGVTYSKDLEQVRSAIALMVKNGRYRERLWDGVRNS